MTNSLANQTEARKLFQCLQSYQWHSTEFKWTSYSQRTRTWTTTFFPSRLPIFLKWDAASIARTTPRPVGPLGFPEPPSST